MANEYDDLLAQEAGATRDQARTTLYGAMQQNPDDVAKAKQLSRTTGLPAEVVSRNLPDVQGKARINEYDSLLADTPALAGKMTDPTFAGMAHDDAETLGEYEKDLRARGGWGQINGPAFRRPSGDIQPSRGPETSISSVLSGQSQVLGNTLERVRQGLRLEIADMFGFDDMAKDAMRKRDQVDFREFLSTPEIENTFGRWVYGGAANIQRVVPSIAAGIATRNPAVGLAGMGAQVQPEAYGKYRARGGTPGEAALGSGLETGVEVATEMLPMGFLVNRFGKVGAGEFLMQYLGRELPTELAAEITQGAIDTAIANPDKTWGDWVNELPDTVGQTVVSTLMMSGGLAAANSVARRFSGERGGAQQAEAAAAAHAEQARIAAASKLRQRDPQTFQEFVEAVEPGAEVYLDAQTLQQSGVDMAALAQASPTVAAQMSEALATGGDIIIPRSEYMARVAGTDLDPVLTPYLRHAADALSLDESQRYYQGEAEAMQAAMTEAAQRQEQDTAWQESARKIEDTMRQQLVASGRYTEDVAQGNAVLTRELFSTLAARLGITPEEAFARYPLQVAADRVLAGQGGRVLGQLSPEQVLRLNIPLKMPSDGLFAPAVQNTPGAEITPEGLRIKLTRYQKPEQDGAQSVRTGVFYLPAGSKDARHYRGSNALGYGGSVVHTGETLLRAPLFVKGATGGKAPEQAYIAVRGKDAFREMESAATRVIVRGGNYMRPDPALKLSMIEKFLAQYAPELEARAAEIERVSREGNTLRYALQEAAIAHAVRAAGHDSVVGYSSTKTGPRISEVFDLREQTYPAKGVESQAHESFLQSAVNAVKQLLTGKPAEQPATTPEPGATLDMGQFFQGAQPAAYTADTIEVDGVERPVMNSNGQRIAQTEEGLRNFWKWFGDSKVVDAEGRPLVVYHGTAYDFDNFDAGRNRTELNDKYQGDGFHFSPDPRIASRYADANRNLLLRKQDIYPLVEQRFPGRIAQLFRDVVEQGYEKAWDLPDAEISEILQAERDANVDLNDLLDLAEVVEGSRYHAGREGVNDPGEVFAALFGGSGGGLLSEYHVNDMVTMGLDAAAPAQNVMPAYLKAEKPLTTDSRKKAKAAQKKGHDGVLYSGPDLVGGVPEWVVFDPTQIKSATGNRGTFDGQDANILNQEGQSDNRAEIAFGSDITAQPSVITLFEKADLSSALHELGHFQLEVLAHIASQPNAPADVVADMEAVFKWFGITGDENVVGGETAGSLGQGSAAQFYDEEGEFTTVEELLAGLKDGRLLVHARVPDGTDFRYGIDPSAGDFLRSTEAWQWAEEEFGAGPELTFFSDSLEWAKSTILGEVRKAQDKGLELVFVRKADNIQKSLGDGRVQLADGSVVSYERSPVADFENPIFKDEPAGVETGDWYTNESQDVVAVAPAKDVVGGTLAQGDQAATPDPASLPKRRTALEVWQAMSLEEKRPYHEQFARGFEAYLFEGRAPSLELASLFRRFASWLKSVYKSMRNLNVEINEEIRGVFDRMIASEDAIKQAQEARALMPAVDESGVHTLAADAEAEAIEELQKRSLRDMRWLTGARGRLLKQMQREAKAQRKAIEDEVRAEVRAMPVYAAMHFLKRGEMTAPDGEQVKVEKGFRLDTDALAEMYPESMLSRPDIAGLKGMTRKDGLHPDLVAEMFGFTSGDQLVREILAAAPEAQMIEGLTDQRTLERHGDLTDPDTLNRAVDEALHNAARAKMVATELKAITKATGPVRVIDKAAKDYAEAMIARKQVKAIKPRQHLAAETRAGKSATAAMKAGDTVLAANEKRSQLIQHHAARAAMDAVEEIRKTREFFKRVITGKDEAVLKTRDLDMVNAARAVLHAYGFGNKAKTATEYLKAVQAYDPDMYAVVKDSVEAAERAGKPFEELTLDEARALRDEIESIWHLAKRSRQMEVDGDLLDREDVQAELHARMEEIGIPDTMPGDASAITPAELRLRKLQSGIAAARRVESWAEAKDGAATIGPFRRFIWQTVKDAADAYRVAKAEHFKKVRDVLENTPGLKRGLIDAPELGYTFGKDEGGVGMSELIHALLHTGNPSNKRKLLLGRRWATENADGTLDTSKWDAFLTRMYNEGRLEKAHWDTVQAIWDIFEATKPLAQKTHRDVFGKYFDEVTAEEVATPFGSYRGGYAPAIADPRIVSDASLRALAEQENENMAYAFPTTPKGFTKSRVEYNRPLLLDLRTVVQHIDKVLRFSYLERPVRDVRRVLMAKDVSYALTRIDPAAYDGLLIPWLNRTAKQQVETPIPGDAGLMRFFSVMRQRAGMAAMFANVSNTVQQITGLSVATIKVKPKYLTRAMAEWVKSPKELARTVAEASPYMATRMDNEAAQMTDTIRDILLDPGVYESAKAWSAKHTYFLQSAFDNVISPVVWLGAYNEATDQGLSEADARRLADGVVRQTQGSTQPEDISRLESGNAFVRLFTQFAGYFNMWANTLGTSYAQTIEEFGVRKGAGRMLYITLFGFLTPAWIAEAIAQAFRGGPDDEDDDGYLDDWLMAVFGFGTVRSLTAMVPVVGQVANATVNAANSKPYDDRLGTSPSISMAESAVRAPVSVYKAIVDDASGQKAVRDVATLITLTTGLPAATVARPMGYLVGVAEDKIDPEGPVDFARGVVTGAKGNQ